MNQYRISQINPHKEENPVMLGMRALANQIGYEKALQDPTIFSEAYDAE